MKKGGLAAGSSIIASISISLSIVVMILAVAISDGFKNEIKNKASGFSGEIMLHSPGVDIWTSQYPVLRNPSFVTDILALPQVKSVYPYVYRSGIIKKEEDIQGVVVRGVDSLYDWSFFKSVLSEGTIPDLNSSGSEAEMLMSKRLASMLGYSLGDYITLYFIDNNVRVRRFLLSGIYDAQLEDIDKTLLITSLNSIQQLNGWSADQVSGVEVKLIRGGYIAATANKIEDIINLAPPDESYYVTRVDELFPHLFEWLKLLDFNVLIVLILMLAVAGFNMISGLLILLFEKISMIGVLKSLGMRDSGIHKIFMARAMYLVLLGVISGNIIAGILVFLQSRYQIIGLDPDNYFVTHVPVFVNTSKMIALNVGAILLIALILLIPSVFISRISPDKTLRIK